MIISQGIPGALSTFESHQALTEDFNLGLGCRQIDRCSNMDDDFDDDNPAYSHFNPWDCDPEEDPSLEDVLTNESI